MADISDITTRFVPLGEFWTCEWYADGVRCSKTFRTHKAMVRFVVRLKGMTTSRSSVAARVERTPVSIPVKW